MAGTFWLAVGLVGGSDIDNHSHLRHRQSPEKIQARHAGLLKTF
jgi:hypothetical protein